MLNYESSLTIQPPTTRLPQIARIQSHPIAELKVALEYIRAIYSPEVRGSRRRRRIARNLGSGIHEKPVEGQITHESSSSTAQYRGESSQISKLRADGFERAYTIRWLTALISSSSELDPEDLDGVDRAFLVEDAASLLALCAGTAAAGRLTRTYTFGSFVQVAITDAPLLSNSEAIVGTDVGAQTWGGACVLAEMIVEDPKAYGIPVDEAKRHTETETETEAFKVLELGAGTGLVGLATATLLRSLGIHAHVLLTDAHSTVLDNLRSNSLENFSETSNKDVVLDVKSLDWSIFASSDTSKVPDIGTFDLILGADIVYEELHARWLRACVAKLLRPPTPSSASEHRRQAPPLFHLVVPLRQTHAHESRTVSEVFGYSLMPQRSTMCDEGRGQMLNNAEDNLRIVHEEIIICDAHSYASSSGTDDDEVVKYAYYRIGWMDGDLDGQSHIRNGGPRSVKKREFSGQDYKFMI